MSGSNSMNGRGNVASNSAPKYGVYKKAGSGHSPLKYLLLLMSSLVFIGIFLCATMAPSEYLNGPSTNSVLTSSTSSKKTWGSSLSLSERILEWVPRHHVADVAVAPDLPDWGNHSIWTPIDVAISSDPMVILCKLNYKKYWESPHMYPMFRDLEGISMCFGSNRRREKLSVLVQEVRREQAAGSISGRVVPPSGFVFHESRVGSTLVANFLASDPWSLVFSESTPIANAILHCETCSQERKLQLFRDVVLLMGRSPFHRRLFFKFQSITCTKMDIALLAFPDTPWAFIFREPVQTMMSHLDPLKGSNAAPCLRSKRDPPPEVASTVSAHVAAGKAAPNEAWCAAHLNMLCDFALQAYEKYGKTVADAAAGSPPRQRGLLVNYDLLPGAVPKLLLPLFGQAVSPTWLEKLHAESKQYSKGRGSGFRLFFGDSKDKEMRATAAIQLYAKKILLPTYETLNQRLLEALRTLEAEWQTSLGSSQEAERKKLAELPPVPAAGGEQAALAPAPDTAATSSAGHSVVLKEKEFLPWYPFSNHHSSKPMEVADCPMNPPAGYPKPYSMIDITNNWNTDSAEIPAAHYDSLCHFDYKNGTQLLQAQRYRAAEVPFVVYNIPEVDNVVHKWNNVDYLSRLLGKKSYRVEASVSNHFMYWNNARGNFLRTAKGKSWKPPTDIVSSQFENWVELAVKGQNLTLENRTHRYFRVSSDMGNEWLFQELPFFKPVKNLFLVDPREQKGIHCRFGMRSVIAEAHFDGSRNSVVMLGGLRRWILTHPDQCVNMHMLPIGHPSGRHSEVDWSKPDLKQFPNFAKLMGNEVILRPGDFLYVPTFWIHYIVSLNVNFQCNTRSGVSHEYDSFIRQCGF